MAPSQLSIPKPWTPIPVPWAWKSTSHTAATPAGNATRTSTASNTTRTTLQIVTRRFKTPTLFPLQEQTYQKCRPTRWSCERKDLDLPVWALRPCTNTVFPFRRVDITSRCRVLGRFHSKPVNRINQPIQLALHWRLGGLPNAYLLTYRTLDSPSLRFDRMQILCTLLLHLSFSFSFFLFSLLGGRRMVDGIPSGVKAVRLYRGV